MKITAEELQKALQAVFVNIAKSVQTEKEKEKATGTDSPKENGSGIENAKAFAKMIADELRVNGEAAGEKKSSEAPASTDKNESAGLAAEIAKALSGKDGSARLIVTNTPKGLTFTAEPGNSKIAKSATTETDNSDESEIKNVADFEGVLSALPVEKRQAALTSYIEKRMTRGKTSFDFFQRQSEEEAAE